MSDENIANPAEPVQQDPKAAELATEELDQIAGGAGEVAIKRGWDQKSNKTEIA